jgi:hypothetical protein
MTCYYLRRHRMYQTPPIMLFRIPLTE